MKIANELPPIFDDLIAGGMQPGPNTLYTYGDIIFNPSGKDIPEDIIVHEEVHMKQQGDNPDYWWSRFIDDQYFRIEQEVEAYAVQYRFICKKHKDRNQRHRILMHFAQVLSSPIYGNVIGTMSAYQMIKKKANV
jgi:hypothetical protein